MLPKGGRISSNGRIVCFQWMEGMLLMDGDGERFVPPIFASPSFNSQDCFQWMEGMLLMDGNGERFGTPPIFASPFFNSQDC